MKSALIFHYAKSHECNALLKLDFTYIFQGMSKSQFVEKRLIYTLDWIFSFMNSRFPFSSVEFYLVIFLIFLHDHLRNFFCTYKKRS